MAQVDWSVPWNLHPPWWKYVEVGVARHESWWTISQRCGLSRPGTRDLVHRLRELCEPVSDLEMGGGTVGLIGWKVGQQVEHVSLLNTHVTTNSMIWNQNKSNRCNVNYIYIYVRRYTQRDQILVTAYSVKALMRLLLMFDSSAIQVYFHRNGPWSLHISIPWISFTKSTNKILWGHQSTRSHESRTDKVAMFATHQTSWMILR